MSGRHARVPRTISANRHRETIHDVLVTLVRDDEDAGDAAAYSGGEEQYPRHRELVKGQPGGGHTTEREEAEVERYHLGRLKVHESRVLEEQAANGSYDQTDEGCAQVTSGR